MKLINDKNALTDSQFEQFRLASLPLIKWLNENKNPHAIVMVSNTTAELFDGNCQIYTEEFLKD